MKVFRFLCWAILAPLLISICAFFFVRTVPLKPVTLTRNVSSPVFIDRDASGVPHIHASNLLDSIYALGYAMSQDRLWQIDVLRRISTGRLSELLGPKTLDLDIFMRNIKIPIQSAKDIAALSDESLLAFQKFSQGINDGAKDQWTPIEYYITRTEWEDLSLVDIQAFCYLQSIGLASSWGNDLLRERLERVIGEAAYWLVPSDISLINPKSFIISKDELPEELRGLSEKREPVYLNNSEEFAFEFEMPETGTGSNSWAISGKYTKSGKPIIANDPHLSSSIPAIWYIAHTYLPNDTLSGFYSGPTPVLAAGRNKRFAWGVTSLKSDDVDLFIEKISGNTYLYGEEMLPLLEFTETINVKGQPPQVITFKETLHGPVLKNPAKGAKLMSSPFPETFMNDTVAFSWSSYGFTDKCAEFAVNLLQAQSIQEIREAVSGLTSMRLSLLVVSDSGDLYFQSTGRIPIRSGSGDRPLPGWIPENRWRGFVSYNDMPYVVNPEKGYIVTANNFPVDTSYKHFNTIGRYFSHGRAERISELIEQQIKSGVKFTSEDMIRMQRDELDVFARERVPVFIQKLKVEKKYQKEVDLMKKWDFVLSRTSVEATIYVNWMIQIARNLLEGKVPEDILNSYMKSIVMQLGMYNIFIKEYPVEQLCDIAATKALESCSELISRSFEKACELSDGKTWGELHSVVLDHAPMSKVSLLKAFFERKQPVGGMYSTVHATHFRWGTNFDSNHGPTMKFISDLGDLTQNYFIIQSGTSGNALSYHYSDMFELFHYGALPNTTYNITAK